MHELQRVTALSSCCTLLSPHSPVRLCADLPRQVQFRAVMLAAYSFNGSLPGRAHEAMEEMGGEA